MTAGRAVGRPHWTAFAVLVALIVALDQATKTALVGALAPGESAVILGDWVRLVHSPNSGGLFGMFRDSVAVFAVMSILVAAGIVWYHGRAGRSAYLTLALGLLLGGAIGNLIDRVTRGYVVDFVDIGIGDIRWWTFNVADSAISAAILLFLALAIRPSLADPAGQTRVDG